MTVGAATPPLASRVVVNTALYPIAVLIDELHSEDVRVRLHSIEHLDQIATALGPERTRKELVPFLTDCVDDNDEVLCAIADKLGSVVEHVGGPEWAHTLIKPLEDLANLEEASVREKAMVSLRRVLAVLPLSQVEEKANRLIYRLASHDWFTCRIAACSLIPDVCRRQFHEDLLRLFVELCGDDTPMVRRQAMASIGPIALVVPSSHHRDLIDVLRRLARDDQDSVRVLTIPTAMDLAKHIFQSPQDCFNALFPEIISCVDDGSWRVRSTVADAIGDILAHTPAKNQSQVFDLYSRLLNDADAEVKTMAVRRLPAACAFKPDKALVALLSPSLNALSRDDSETVRAMLAESLARCAPVFGPTLTAECLVNFILKSLRDHATSVRLRVVANMDNLASMLRLEEMTPCLMPAITELATDRQWRVRLAILEFTPDLARHLGEKLFTEELLPVAVRWLCDPVFKVREAATVNLQRLTATLGNTWSVNHIVPHLTELCKNSNYLYR